MCYCFGCDSLTLFHTSEYLWVVCIRCESKGTVPKIALRGTAGYSLEEFACKTPKEERLYFSVVDERNPFCSQCGVPFSEHPEYIEARVKLISIMEHLFEYGEFDCRPWLWTFYSEVKKLFKRNKKMRAELPSILSHTILPPVIANIIVEYTCVTHV